MKKVVLYIFLMLSVCTSYAAEQDVVQEAFDGYKSAILRNDGHRAVDLVSARTIDEYQKYIDWARFADRPTLKSLSMINRLQVIMFRHRVPAEELRLLDGRKAFGYAVDRDWIGKNDVIRTSLGDIALSSGRATAAVLIGGRKTPLRFQFVQESQKWRFDLITVMRDSDSALQALAKKQGVSEDELIFSLVETVSGEEVSDSIWDPVL